MELFADRLSGVFDFVFSLCRNNTGNFPLDLVVYHNDSYDLDGDTTFNPFVEPL